MYNLPPLNSLRAFEATARHLSFTKAAEELCVTPAALSHQVKALEEYLGVSLFRRLTRAIELTEEAKLCLTGVSGGFQQMHDAIAQLGKDKDDNVLVISCGPAFSAKWLTPRLYRFISKHPEIDPRISANLSHASLERDGIDVAIKFGDGDYPGCYAEELMGDSVTLMCSPALMGPEGGLKSLKDVKNQTFIHDETTTGFSGEPVWQDWLEKAGLGDVDTSHGLRFNFPDHCLDAAASGSGVALGRSVIAMRDIALGRLVVPFDIAITSRRSFYFVCLKNALNTPKIKAFQDWLWAEKDRND